MMAVWTRAGSVAVDSNNEQAVVVFYGYVPYCTFLLCRCFSCWLSLGTTQAGRAGPTANTMH